MTLKEIKAEARKKLALNIHQAIVIYTVEFAVFITLIALIVMSCVSLGVITPAAIVMICYGAVLCIIAIIGTGMLSFAMCDYYLATYKCKPYNIRRLGDTLARSGVTKLLLLSLKRTLIAFLLLLCLIVPGIIYLIRTSMANYLLIANPKMNASKALSASNKVMSGKTGSYFVLCISLIGWYLLGLLTLGLGFVFILPYVNLIKAVYYKRNLQGDKTVYNVVVQPVSVTQMQQQQTTGVSAQQGGGVAPQDDVVLAPIDTLADDDMQDMANAMRDFERGGQVADVREVPISPVTASKNAVSSEGVQNVQPIAEGDNSAVESHVIDGTSLVETERILSTQEIDASNDIYKQKLEAMYSNTSSKKSKVDYFAMDKLTTDDFDDDFGVIPEQDNAQSEEPSQAEPPIDIISDSEFDEFLKDFDNVTAQEENEEQQPIVESDNEPIDNEPIIEPIIEPVAEQPAEPLNSDENADTNSNGDTERPDRAASARAARERINAHDHHVPDRSSRRPVGTDNNNGEVVDRAERVRREREERLNLNNKK